MQSAGNVSNTTGTGEASQSHALRPCQVLYLLLHTRIQTCLTMIFNQRKKGNTMTADPKQHDKQGLVTDRLEETHLPQRAVPSASEAQVTSRLPAASITDRLPSVAVTERFETVQVTEILKGLSSPQLLEALRLKPGELVAERYRVKEGPLGKATGEAEIFRCQDRK